MLIKIGREEPVASMDASGKIIWARHNEIQTVNVKSLGAEFEDVRRRRDAPAPSAVHMRVCYASAFLCHSLHGCTLWVHRRLLPCACAAWTGERCCRVTPCMNASAAWHLQHPMLVHSAADEWSTLAGGRRAAAAGGEGPGQLRPVPGDAARTTPTAAL